MRRVRDEHGFSLVELVVVVLIIAVLLAIAIPTYLGSQRSAGDRAAQSDLRNALTVAKTVAAYSSPARFQIDGTDVTPTDLEAADPSLEFDSVANAGTATVGVAVDDDGGLITLMKQSTSQSWFGISADWRGRITFCSGATADACDDAATDGYAADSW